MVNSLSQRLAVTWRLFRHAEPPVRSADSEMTSYWVAAEMSSGGAAERAHAILARQSKKRRVRSSAALRLDGGRYPKCCRIGGHPL
jgi:hypothetical protein